MSSKRSLVQLLNNCIPTK